MRLFHYILIFTFLLCGCFFSCGVSPEKKKIVTVTIQPQKFFAEKIAGDKYEINCIVPPGSNPEAYDPSPSHLVYLGKSQAYFKIGYIGFEIAWMDKLVQNNPHMKVFDNSSGVSLIKGTHHDGHAEHFGADGADPHIWSSPKNALIIARNMYDAFVQLDTENKSYYKKNYEELVKEINQVDDAIKGKLSGREGEMFAIYHPSLSYLARDYGLKQLSIEYNGKEPSALYIKEAIDMARKNKVKVVFIQKEFDMKQAEVFAQAVGCKVVAVNPLNYEWSSELINIANAIGGE